MSQISELTSEQEALIPVYREKWRSLVIPTQSINHAQATTAVEALYAALGKPKPEVYFFQSPQALKQVCEKYSLSTLREVFGLPTYTTLSVAEKVLNVLKKQFETKLWSRLESELTVPQEIMTLRQAASINMLCRFARICCRNLIQIKKPGF